MSATIQSTKEGRRTMKTTVALKKNIKTNQQAFDAVVRHLAKQKVRSVIYSDAAVSDDGTMCVYLDPKTGNRCAVGALMTVPNARSAERTWSGATPTALFRGVDLPVSIVLLESLQRAHDSNSGDYDYDNGDGNAAHRLRQRLYAVAERFDLDDSLVVLITEWEGDTL